MKKLFLLTALCLLGFADTLEEILANKKIRIGVRFSQPPYSQLVDGEFVGFEVDLANAIAKKIIGPDAQVELVGVNAADRIPFLDENKADVMIANFSITPERAQKVLFGAPYLTNNEALVSKKDANIDSIDDVNGIPVLVVPGSTSEAFAKSKNWETVPCENTKDCFMKLENGVAKAYLHTNILNATLPLMDMNLETSLPILGNFTFIAPGVEKSNEALIKAVNSAIYELSEEGFFKKAYQDDLEPFYKGALDKKFLLLDDMYNSLNLM